MANSQEDDVRARGSLAGSEEALILPAEPRRGSNSRAFKVAGLTTLACLLLASQVFTAYFVYNQKQQIHTLQQNSEKMGRQLTRSSQAVPMRRHVPMLSHPLMKDFTLDEDVKTITPTKPPVIDPVVSVEKQVKDLMQESQLPHFNETFLANLQSLQQQLNESDWKSFESWMRYWLIFQMAQQKPAPPTTKPAPVVKTDCQIEAAREVGKIGVYKPQCDEQGRYKPMQCWHSTGFCWCVDESGTVIEGTTVRGRPDCSRDGAAAPYRMMLAAGGPIEKLLSADDQ